MCCSKAWDLVEVGTPSLHAPLGPVVPWAAFRKSALLGLILSFPEHLACLLNPQDGSVVFHLVLCYVLLIFSLQNWCHLGVSAPWTAQTSRTPTGFLEFSDSWSPQAATPGLCIVYLFPPFPHANYLLTAAQGQ